MTQDRTEEQIEAARSVVYDEDGEFIEPDEIEDAIEDYGVDVGVGDDGVTQYQNVPHELSLSACYLAVDLRRDPAEFIIDTDHITEE